MIYCDTSLRVPALLLNEPASLTAKAWLSREEHQGLATSAWVHVELAGATAMKTRRRDLDDATRARTLQLWSSMQTSFSTLPIGPEHSEHAAMLLLQPGSRLRSGDALHLAVALVHGCRLATLDHDLHEAAMQYGIGTDVIAAA